MTDHRVDDPDWICSGATRLYEYSRLCKARPEPCRARRALLQNFRVPGRRLSDGALKAGDHEVVLKDAEPTTASTTPTESVPGPPSFRNTAAFVWPGRTIVSFDDSTPHQTMGGWRLNVMVITTWM